MTGAWAWKPSLCGSHGMKTNASYVSNKTCQLWQAVASTSTD